MKLEYKLENSGFLEHKLYTYSKSERGKKNRMLGRIIIPLLYVAISVFYILKIPQNIVSAVIFSLFGIVWFIFYPIYTKRRYKKHFENDIKEYYQKKVGTPIEIEFNSEFVFAKDVSGESKIYNSQLKELIELKNHFFLKLETGDSLVIPKTAVSDINEFKQMISDLHIKYLDELNWKWK